jgi:hypothetical protein
LTALRTQGLAAQHACRQIHGDESLGEAERHRRAAKASADLIVAALPIVEKARAVHEKSIAELRAMLAGPAIEVSDVQAVEIRTRLSGLPQAARVSAIIRSIEKGSDLTAAVVLGSDRFLVDFLSDIELSAIREAWGRARHPDEVRVLAQRESDLGHLERGASVIQSWQRQTHNPAIAATGIIPAGSGTSRGPIPVNRGLAPTLAQRAAMFTYSRWPRGAKMLDKATANRLRALARRRTPAVERAELETQEQAFAAESAWRKEQSQSKALRWYAVRKARGER